jgi:UDP-N-acetyl-D-mannosaminuronate dehydrogenase
MPGRLVAQAAGVLGDLTGLTAVVLGAAYRGGVKETAFSGVFATVEALQARGAKVSVHDPLYTDAELERFGWTPFHIGESADLAIVQADHADYAQLGATDFPGIRLLVDGRNATAADRWVGTPRLVIGAGGVR